MTQPTTKLCVDCKTERPVGDFHKAPENRDRLDVRCKSCSRIRYDKENPHSVFALLHEDLQTASERNGYPPLHYSVAELKDWAAALPDLDDFWAAYEKSDYSPRLRPLLDRIDPTKPFTLDNLQLTVRGARIPPEERPVAAFRADGTLYKGYPSAREAALDVKGKASVIRSVAAGELMKNGHGERRIPKEHRGFVWRWL